MRTLGIIISVGSIWILLLHEDKCCYLLLHTDDLSDDGNNNLKSSAENIGVGN